MRPIRVLYFASTNSKSGGSLHSLADLASYLQRSGQIEPLVVLPGYGTAEELLQSVNVPCVVLKNYGSEWPLNVPRPIRSRLSHFRQRFENLKAIRSACRLVRDKGIDLIHINTSVNEIGYYVARRTKKPFIWHIREFVSEGLGLEFYNSKRVYRHMKKADAVIAISSQLQRRYEQILAPKKVSLVHNGIDVERFYYDGPKPQVGPLIMAMVGRVSRLKGHYDVVDAIAACPKLHVRLLIIGAQDEEFMEYTKQKGVCDKIECVGYQDDVRPWLNKSHVFISAHPWEAFGRAAVEAMLAGCCVIGVNNAGTTDLIEDGRTGLLYKRDDIPALCETIMKASLDRPMIQMIGEKARQCAMSQFSIERCCHAILSLMQTTRIVDMHCCPRDHKLPS